MLQLIYASAAVKPFTPQDLAELLAKARKKNDALDISGMLLCHAGSFLQVLEGPDDAITALFKIIEKDPRHTTVRVLYRDGEVTRDFWSRLMFPKLVEQGGLDHDEAFYDRGDYPQAA